MKATTLITLPYFQRSRGWILLLLLLILPASLKAELSYSTTGNTITITGIGIESTTGSLTIPSTIDSLPVTSIGEKAFQAFSGLTSVTIPDSVTSIGEQAFSMCGGLTSVTIGNSVTSIGFDAFYNCNGLTSVTIPNSVTFIGNTAFMFCSGLTSVTIPNSVTSMGEGAFRGCIGLTSVTIPNSVTSIGDQSFYNCSGLTSVIIPSSVTSIGDQSFAGCSGLTSVTIPSSVTSIGFEAFSACSGLTSVVIEVGLISIGEKAFADCKGLTGVIIPSSVTSIGNSAFRLCTNLTMVFCKGDAPTANDSIFAEISPGTVYYLEGKTGWNVSFGGWWTAVFEGVPSITSQPVSVNVFAGSPASFQVTATGTPPLTYQWKKNDINIPNATQSVFSLASAKITDAGTYQVIVSNGAGSVTSNPVQLTIVSAIKPSIIQEPKSLFLFTGFSASLQVTATGTPPLTYQWKKNDIDIPNATQSVFSLALVKITDAGTYQVIVSNKAGSVPSKSVQLTVNASLILPSITTQPVSVNVFAGFPASFQVTATGTPPLIYQWKKNNINIPNATQSVFSLASAKNTDAGTYQVIVSNGAGSVTSKSVQLKFGLFGIVQIKWLSILAHTATGSPAYLAVVATGTPPLFYQWSKDGVTLDEATDPVLYFDRATAADAGLYQVTVSNSDGEVLSQTARLTVDVPGLPADNTLVLELSTDLTNPLWTPIATNSVSGREPQRFYRLVPR